LKQLGEEAAKSLIPPTGIALVNDHIVARPDIAPMPFAGIHFMNYFIRPPVQRVGTKRLQLTYQLTVRTGVAVNVYSVGDDLGTVGVSVAMNDSLYKPAALPPKNDINISLDAIKNEQNLGPALTAGQASAIVFLANPAVAGVLQRGVGTDRYMFPV